MKHGLASRGKMHPLYRLLKNLEARCYYPSATHFQYYGGRGISVHDEWRTSPAQFVAWAEANGWRPGLEIDRKDNNGHYEPNNCVFITHRANSQKTSRIHTTPAQVRLVRAALLRHLGIKAAAIEAGVSYMVAWHIKNTPGVWSNVS